MFVGVDADTRLYGPPPLPLPASPPAGISFDNVILSSVQICSAEEVPVLLENLGGSAAVRLKGRKSVRFNKCQFSFFLWLCISFSSFIFF